MMQTRLPQVSLGRSGLRSSRLGLSGSWGIDASAVERAFHELGVTHFYVMPGMHGLIEGLRRLIAQGHRDQLVLQSGSFVPFGWALARGWEKLARSLGVDCIDIFQVLAVRSRWFVGGKTWPTLQRFKEQGKVRAIGFSCHNRRLALALSQELASDILMIRYNAAHRGAEREIFELLGEPRPGIVAYTATRWGKLLKPLVGHGAMTAPECYRFQLGHPKVDVGLCGPKSWEELQADVAGVLAGPLGSDRLEEVRRFGDAVRASAAGRVF